MSFFIDWFSKKYYTLFLYFHSLVEEGKSEFRKINLVNLGKAETYSRLSLVIFPCPKASK